MIEKEFFLLVILLVAFLRAVIKRVKGNFNTDYLIVSLVVTSAPFNFTFSLKELIDGKFFTTADLDFLSLPRSYSGFGSFGSSLSINAALLFTVLIALTGAYKIHVGALGFKKNKWFYSLMIFSIVSYINPYNLIPIAIFPLLFYFLQIFLLMKLIEMNFKGADLLKGTFDGLVILTISNVALTICFPILNIEEVATFLYGKIALLNASRREGYPAALGIFVHPLPLGIFTLLPLSFFVSCYLKGYQSKRLLTILILSNIFVCVFSFSRTSYLAILISMITLLVVYNQKTKLRISKKLVTSITAIAVLVGVVFVYLTMFENLLLFKNAGKMLGFREEHWQMAYEIWKQSKVIGIGLNTDVYFMQHRGLMEAGSLQLTTVNYAVHSIHLGVLAQTGLIGIAVWLCFVVMTLRGMAAFTTGKTALAPDIFKMSFLAIFVGAIIVFGSFNPLPFSVLSSILFFGFLANGELLSSKTTPAG